MFCGSFPYNNGTNISENLCFLKKFFDRFNVLGKVVSNINKRWENFKNDSFFNTVKKDL